MRWSGSPRVSIARAPIRNSLSQSSAKIEQPVATHGWCVRWRPCCGDIAARPWIAVVSSTGMVKEGYYFGLPPLVLGAAVYLLYSPLAGVVLVLLAAFVFYFF